MKRWWMIVVGVGLLALPAAADCCRSDGHCGQDPVCSQGTMCSLCELERSVVNLRWQLHELDYSDLATTMDKQALAQKYAKAEAELRAARAATSQVAKADAPKACVMAAAPAG